MRLLFRVIFYSIVFISLVVILPGNILLDIEPKEPNNSLPQSFTGALKPNDRLSKTTKLFEGQIFAPESLAQFNGKLVAGSGDGFLYLIDGSNIKRLFKLVEKSCAENPYNTSRCGRPAGMRFDSKGTLFVVEPSNGVFSVENIFTAKPKVKQVFDLDQTNVLGLPSKYINDLAIDEGAGLNGGHVLYISDDSQKFDPSQLGLIFFASDMGRVIKYDINAKKVESIAENLLFPNGVEITDDRNAILVNEFIGRQVDKIYIKGPKRGQIEVVSKNLPGEIDNIRRSASKDETYWLALFSARTIDKPNKFDYYQSRPLLCKVVCRLLHLFGNGIEFVGKVFNNSLVKEFGYDMKTGRHLFSILFNEDFNDYAMIIEIDANGQILDSLQASDITLAGLSQVTEVRLNDKQTVLYMGNIAHNHLGKLTLNR